jgi:hypothetical protein
MSNPKRKNQKALETILYLAERDHRHYWLLKAIYLADKEHLQRFGRQIFDDNYIAMKDGPVPSLAYDLIKCARGDGRNFFADLEPQNAINVPDRFTVIPKRPTTTDLFSPSELECLDHAFQIVKPLSFGQLKALSHDAAYLAADQDGEMSVQVIVASLANGKEVIDYLHSS